jgi:hypothetical protein
MAPMSVCQGAVMYCFMRSINACQESFIRICSATFAVQEANLQEKNKEAFQIVVFLFL